MKPVFHHIMTSVAAQCHTSRALIEVTIGVTVIADEPSTVRGYPDKPVTVGIDIINEIARKPVRHVQI